MQNSFSGDTGFTVGGADGRSSQVGELSKETIVVNLQKSAATANGSAGSSHRKSFSVSPSLMSLPEGAGADDDSDSDCGFSIFFIYLFKENRQTCAHAN